jgi:hypothetical protein
MPFLRSVTLLLVLASSAAFAPLLRTRARSAPAVFRQAHKDDVDATASPVPASTRRTLLQSAAAALVAAASLTVNVPDAAATYTAYTRREEDWDARQDKGQVTYSNARALRQQLREIVPQNTESSRIFCPNGPSSAVSPLMENKCGDRLAIPSVYGRTQDLVGNSIPGFSDRSYPMPAATAGSGSIVSDIGGFPAYSSSANKVGK